MAIRVTCPECDASVSVDEAKRGKTIFCRKCEEPIKVPKAGGNSKRDDDDDDAVQEGRKVKAKAASQKSDDDVHDDEVERRRPVPRKRAPAPSSSNTSVMVFVSAGVVFLAFFFICVAVIGGYFYFGRKGNADKGDDAQAQANKLKDDAAKNDHGDQLPKDNRKDKGNPNLGNQIDPAVMTRVKAAAVYLKVVMGNGQIGEGSGFLIEPSIVITNAHVLGMLLASNLPPRSVEVVANKGLANEARVPGQVLGVDRVSDLGVVRVNPAGLPAPIAIDPDSKLIETQRVWIFGFPFGEALGNTITVSESAISSLRPDALGTLERIQLNGGANPGNSGGPVVDSSGKVVGVLVSGIKGAQINFAIPAEKVRRVLEGRLADHRHGEAYIEAGKFKLPVHLTCLDPLNKIREVRVDVWTGVPGQSRPISDQKPPALPGDGQKATHLVNYVNGTGALDVPLPALQPGQAYWVQPVITSAKGTHWAPAISTGADFSVVERKAADLTINLTRQKERTSRMESRMTVTESLGGKERKVIDQTSVELLEVVQDPAFDGKGKRVTKISTAFGAMGIRVFLNGMNINFNRDEQDALSLVRTMPPTFVIDEANVTAGYITVSLTPKHPKYFLKDMLADFNGMVHNPYEATQFKMPNRTIQPLETFQSSSTMMMRSTAPAPKGGPQQRAMIHDLKMNCTLEGVRVRNGREEAVITVVGTMEGRDRLAGRTLGIITGKIGFDVAGGFVSSAKLKIFAELEGTIAGLGTIRETFAQDIDLDRAPGNPKNIQLAKEKPDPGPVQKLGPPSPSPAKGKLVLNLAGNLQLTDPIDPAARAEGRDAHYKIFSVTLIAGKTYVISMNSMQFDTFLRLLGPAGKQVAFDDDGGGNLNARIIYTPTQTGLHRIVATSFQPKSTGNYQLIVQELK